MSNKNHCLLRIMDFILGNPGSFVVFSILLVCIQEDVNKTFFLRLYIVCIQIVWLLLFLHSTSRLYFTIDSRWNASYGNFHDSTTIVKFSSNTNLDWMQGLHSLILNICETIHKTIKPGEGDSCDFSLATLPIQTNLITGQNVTFQFWGIKGI